MLPRFLFCCWAACLLGLLVLSTLAVKAQVPATDSLAHDRQEKALFAKYAVSVKRVARPARPRLTTGLMRNYRTQILQQAAKGPNFAGHYTIASWSWGVACSAFVVVDTHTGVVVADPEVCNIITFSEHPRRGLIYRKDSRLLVADGAISGVKDDGRYDADSTYYFEWTGSHFQRVSNK